MKNEEIVKMLRRCDVKHCDGCPLLRKEGCVMLLKNEAAELIEKLTDRCARYAEEIAVLQERTRWIPVDERLPEDGDAVLCWYEYFRFGEYNQMYRTYGIGYYIKGMWGGDVSNGRNTKVLAWMPLPDGPEVE